MAFKKGKRYSKQKNHIKKKPRKRRKIKLKYEEPDEQKLAPHSFVIHRGTVGHFIQQLEKDFRKVMQPFTATDLQVSKKNTLKDFVAVAGPLKVSHMAIFTSSAIGPYMRIARVPRGPTLMFRIHNYSLCKDVLSSLKKQTTNKKLFANSPLIILNNFTGEGMHIKLMASTFQNMFPTINASKYEEVLTKVKELLKAKKKSHILIKQFVTDIEKFDGTLREKPLVDIFWATIGLIDVKLSEIRRCVVLNYNTTTKLIDFRHYAIRVVPVGISKSVKKIVQSKIPDLSRYEEISEFIVKPSMLSESEAEDDPNSHVEIPQKIPSRGNLVSEKSSIRLSELGPRLTLQLLKIEDGLLNGEVLFHEFIQKTAEEKLAIRKRLARRRKLKEQRKQEQEENVKRKQKEKELHKQRSLEGMKRKYEAEVQVEEQPENETKEDEHKWIKKKRKFSTKLEIQTKEDQRKFTKKKRKF